MLHPACMCPLISPFIQGSSHRDPLSSSLTGPSLPSTTPFPQTKVRKCRGFKLQRVGDERRIYPVTWGDELPLSSLMESALWKGSPTLLFSFPRESPLVTSASSVCSGRKLERRQRQTSWKMLQWNHLGFILENKQLEHHRDLQKMLKAILSVMLAVNFINSLKHKQRIDELAWDQLVSVVHVWILAPAEERQTTPEWGSAIGFFPCRVQHDLC